MGKCWVLKSIRELFFTDVHKVPRLDGMSKNPARKNRESVPVKDNFELELLQAQYKELKEKVSDLTCGFCSYFIRLCMCYKALYNKIYKSFKTRVQIHPHELGERKPENFG